MPVAFIHTLRRGLAFSALLCLVALSLSAQQEPDRNIDPAEVLAYQGDIVLTQREIDAAFSKLDEADRLQFIRNGGKVDQLLGTLLKRKAIASDARQAGLDQDPVIAARMQLEAEKELAEARLQQIVEDAPAADYEALAYEDYLANPDRYRTPETLDVSHILIKSDRCDPSGSLKKAEELASRLGENPGLFDEFVTEYSEDPAKSENGGRYPEMRRGEMVKNFEEAAFAMLEPGDISGLVKTEYGWHIIRLNGRGGNELPEFDEIKERAVSLAERRYRENYRENYLRKVLSDPIVLPEGAVEITAKRYFGENFELAPDHRQ